MSARAAAIGLALAAATVTQGAGAQQVPAIAAPDATAARDRDGDARDAARAWFDGERRSGWLWGSVGVAGLGAGAALLAGQRDVTYAMAGPLLGFGLVQTAIGVLLLTSSRGRWERLEASPPGFLLREHELARIRRVNRSFLALGVVESFLLVGGAIVLGAGAAQNQDVPRGLGVGLAIEAAAMLLCDGLAHERGEAYERALTR